DPGRVGVDVAGQALVGAGDADVEDGRAGPQHVLGDQSGRAGGGDDDVGLADMPGEALGAGVAQGDGGVLGAAGEEQSDRASHRDAAVDHAHACSGDRHPVPAEQLDDSARGAGQRRLDAQRQPAEVDGVQSVGVLGRVHAFQYGVRVEVARERELDDVAGAGRVGVEFVDDVLDLALGGVGGQVAA